MVKKIPPSLNRYRTVRMRMVALLCDIYSTGLSWSEWAGHRVISFFYQQEAPPPCGGTRVTQAALFLNLVKQYFCLSKPAGETVLAAQKSAVNTSLRAGSNNMDREEIYYGKHGNLSTFLFLLKKGKRRRTAWYWPDPKPIEFN